MDAQRHPLSLFSLGDIPEIADTHTGEPYMSVVAWPIPRKIKKYQSKQKKIIRRTYDEPYMRLVVKHGTKNT